MTKPNSPGAPRFELPAGTEMTLGGGRVMINGKDALGYLSTDLTTGESRSIPFQSFVDYLNLPGTKLDTALPLTGDRLKQRLGGYASSGGLSAAQQADARFHVAICKAMIFVREQMREETGDQTLDFSIRKAEDKREAIAAIVQTLTGEKVYLSQTRGGKPQKARRYLYKGRKLRNLLTTYEGLVHDESAFDALVPLDHLKGNRTPRITGRTKELMMQAWEQIGLDTKRPSVADVLRHLEFLIREENQLRCRNDLQPLQIPSASTLLAFRKETINETAYLVATTGERNARNRRGSGSTDIRSLLIGEYVEIDECKASLVVSAKASGRWESLSALDRKTIEEIDKEIRERLHILVMLDVATRMPLAWIVSDQPRAEATLALFRMATRSKAREARKFGCEGQAVPGIGIGHVKNDNGPGLRNSTAIGALMGIAGMNTVSRAYSPTERPYIERMFGTQEAVLLRLIHGYTGRKPGDLPGYDAVENGVLDIEELMGILTRFMIDEYPAMRHTGIGMGGRRPIEVWNEINAVRGCFKHLDPHTRRIHLGWKQQVKPTDEGVRVFSGLWFDSDELRQTLDDTKHGGTVTVFVDPDDVTHATVLVPKAPLPVTVTLQITAFADLTLPEVLELLEILRREDPAVTELYEDRLARIRRERFDQLRAIGVEKKLKRSYSTLDECLRKAQHLFAGARIIRNQPLAGTVPAGRITDMKPGSHVFQIAGNDMLIDGEAQTVDMSDLIARGPEDDGTAVEAAYGHGLAEAEGTEITGHFAAPHKILKQKTKTQKPAAPTLGRPTRLRDLE